MTSNMKTKEDELKNEDVLKNCSPTQKRFCPPPPPIAILPEFIWRPSWIGFYLFLAMSPGEPQVWTWSGDIWLVGIYFLIDYSHMPFDTE